MGFGHERKFKKNKYNTHDGDESRRISKENGIFAFFVFITRYKI